MDMNTNALSIIEVPAGLREKAIIVSLTIHQWRPVRSDERADAVVQSAFSTDRSAGAFRKNLLPQQPAEWRRVTAAASAISVMHRYYTQPWEHGGRVMASALYPVYSQKLREAMREYDEAADAFVAVYPRLRDEAVVLLGGLARSEDYPNERSVRASFGVDLSTTPLAQNDWRVNLPAQQIEELKRQYDASLGRALEAANADLWQRLRDAVEAVRKSAATYEERLKSKGAGKLARLGSGNFDSLNELIEVLPAMNLAGDADLDALVEKVRSTIGSVDPDDMRDSVYGGEVRSEVITAADDIVAQMAAFMGGAK